MLYNKCNEMVRKALSSLEPSNSEEKFEASFREYNRNIYKYFLWRTHDVQLSEDLASTVFEKAWRSHSRFQGNSMRAWLFSITRNVLTDYWRRKKEVPTADFSTFETGDDDAATVLDAQQRLTQLRQAVAILPSEMRLVVTLRFIEGYTAKQVAEQIGTTEGNIRVIQYRALKKLKKAMQ